MGKTSTKAKNAWMARNYVSIQLRIDKDDGIAFREKCKENGDIQADILRAAVYDYLGKPIPPSKAKF